MCFRPKRLEIYGESLYLARDACPAGLVYFDQEERKVKNIQLYEKVDPIEGYSAFVVENAYKNEIQKFYGRCRRQDKSPILFF